MTNDIVFNGKNLPDVLSEIHYHATSKREMINAMIAKLVPLAKTPEEASIIFPIIKDFMDTAIKNDQHIVQIAQIIQRIQSATIKNESGASLLSEMEKQDILRMISGEVGIMSESPIDELTTKADDAIKLVQKK